MTTPPGTLAFVGGGNMASALIGGLRATGHPGEAIVVVEPSAGQRERLVAQFGVRTLPAADASLGAASMVVWAVKPQLFAQAAAPCAAHVGAALHLSVMAGIRCETIVRVLGLPVERARIVRSMPNTPALIGRGIAGLWAMGAVREDERRRVEQVLASTGQILWVGRESDLDAVTALSGSGPAYVFYFVEAMTAAAVEMGLPAEQGKRLATATFDGAAALAAGSADPPEVLRERVTSRGGTTFAALQSLEADAVKSAFVRALHAAHRRARELGDEFG